MAQVRFTNVAKTTLNGAITDVATSIVVNDGSVFPSLSGGDWFYLTLEDTSLNREVVKVTARSTNTLTVTRAQDGTTARAFSNADKAEIRVCAALLTDLVSAAYILSALLTVDGSSSGLDADLLDGLSSAAFAQLASANSFTANQTILTTGASSNLTVGGNASFAANILVRSNSGQARTVGWQTQSTLRWGMQATNAAESGSNAGTNFSFIAYDDSGTSLGSVFDVTRSTRVLNFVVTPTIGGSTIWTAANDGASSGLDADLLRGTTPSAYGLTLIDDADAAAARTTLALGTAATQNTGTSGANVPLMNGTNTWSAAQIVSLAGTPLRSINSNDATSNQALRLESDRATPTVGDTVFLSFYASDSVGTQTEFGRISAVASTVTDASEAGYITFGATTAGTLANVMRMTGAALSPHANDGLALGTTSLMWSDLFLASGGVINFNNGDVTITHSSNTLAFAGAATGYTFDGNVSSSTTGTGAPLTLISTDAGASAFTFDIYRNSASPAANDAIAAMRFRGQNSSAAAFTYATIQANISDPTAGSEDSVMYLTTVVAGASVNALALGSSATTHKFNNPGDCIVTSVGNSGYGAFYPQGSGTNNSYIFMGNATSGERSRITASDARTLSFSNDGGVTAHLSISSAGALSASGNTIWTAANDGSSSGLDADMVDGKHVGTSGNTVPLLDGTNTWSGTQTMSALTARVTLTTAVSGTLTASHANVSLELNGNVTLPNSVFTAGDKTVFDPGTSARTFTRGSGIAMYVNGVDSASATLAANQMGGAHWRSSSVVVLSGGFT